MTDARVGIIDTRAVFNIWHPRVNVPTQPRPTFNFQIISILKEVKPPKKLTPLELQGLSLARSLIRNKTFYISQADKGGATLIFDAEIVHQAILRELGNPTAYSLQTPPGKPHVRIPTPPS